MNRLKKFVALSPVSIEHLKSLKYQTFFCKASVLSSL